MSFNIYLGTWDGNGLAKTLNRSGAEIVALQEYAPKRFRRHPGLKKLYRYQARCSNWRRCTLAILSQHPLTDIKRYSLGKSSSGNHMHAKMLAATVHVKGQKPVQALYCPSFAGRCQLATQRTQFRTLIEILNREKAKYPNQILLGDFNSTGWSFTLDQMMARSDLERQKPFRSDLPLTQFTDQGDPEIARFSQP